MQKYSIVEFSEENTVEVILSSWISPNNKTSLWPKNITPSILKRYLKNNTAPSDNWRLVNIRILGYAGIDCYVFLYDYLIFSRLYNFAVTPINIMLLAHIILDIHNINSI